jgi:hypothetical protein
MARPKGLKKKKLGIPQELADQILALPAADLAVEAAREQLALDTLKKQVQNDHQIVDLKSQLDALVQAADEDDKVVAAYEAYEELRQNTLGEEYDKTKQDLKALRQGWNADLKGRKKKLKFMMKTLRSHMESGALKSKME